MGIGFDNHVLKGLKVALKICKLFFFVIYFILLLFFVMSTKKILLVIVEILNVQ